KHGETVDAETADQEPLLPARDEALGPIDEPAVREFEWLIPARGEDLEAEPLVVSAAALPIRIVSDLDAVGSSDGSSDGLGDGLHPVVREIRERDDHRDARGLEHGVRAETDVLDDGVAFEGESTGVSAGG